MPPGNPLIKPVALAKPKLVVGPQNVGLPTYRPGDVNNPNGALAPPPGIVAAAAPAPVAAPAAPAPPNFSALINADPNYINAEADRASANQRALQALQQGFAQTSQSAQDNANHHGALFSGAAVNAQRYLAQQNTQQQEAQAASNLQQQHGNIAAGWQRILNQIAGVA